LAKAVWAIARRLRDFCLYEAGVAQLARVSAFQAEGCGFETRLPLQVVTRVIGVNGLGPCGSGVEHTLGKGEVVSSSLTMGSRFVVFGYKKEIDFNLKKRSRRRVSYVQRKV
jgi:hypothetical protein